jgi:seryl-tRNA synthetase
MLLDEFLAVAPAGRARNEALETAAFVRMSSPPDARDLRRARELLIERQAASPPSPRPLELSATLALIEESVALRGELEEARAAAAADRQSLEERGAAAARDQRQLRAENASLRTEVKNLREELRKKEDALQKLAATVVKTKPRD